MEQDDDPALAETQSPALVDRPRGDARARNVARAKIANALFAKHETVELGRYRLLDRVGEGGMGVVWGAYDPELERRVAIKLVRAQASASRERILLEGQALAKLSHPNVVAVYDVGVVDDEVYLVMEWIRGHNLRVHLAQSRTVAEIVALFRAAGEGLYAAHQAGLVHRDFKPENVMIGDDGRVRVLDFGLALDRDGASDRHVAGTPRYMAPEQQRGDEVTFAADQYAFGVALREALGGRHADKRLAPLPGWLASIVERATARAPADRFASMDEVLAALARDPATVWRRRVVIVAAASATAAAFAVGSLRADGPEACAGSREEIARVWNPPVQAALVAHGATLGPYGVAEAPRIAGDLAAYGERWASAHRGACLAHRRGEVTTRLYERGLTCFTRARAAFATVVDVLSRTTVASYPDAVKAARSLPDAHACLNDAVDSPVEPPPRELGPIVAALDGEAARARFLALASDPQALVVATSTAAAAESLAYGPLVARTQLALGAALATEQSGWGAAVSAFGRSAATALAASDDPLFVEAYARQIYFASRMQPEQLPAGSRDVIDAAPYVETIAARAGERARFARALLLNNLGAARLAAGDVASARTWFRKARDELRRGALDIELQVALGNLAMVTDFAEERTQLFTEERAALERALGPTHAFTLLSRLRAAGYVEDAGAAMQMLAEVCAAYTMWYPHEREHIAKCNYELGWLAVARGELASARRAYEIVVATGFGQEALVARAYLALEKSPAEAEHAALAVVASTNTSDPWFVRFPAAVDAWSIAALARRESGNRGGAIEALRAALDALRDPRINQKAPRYRRRFERTRSTLDALMAAP